jgi:cation transporter-like permease
LKKRQLLLILGIALAIAGVIIAVVPVETTVGFGCGNLGCVAYETIFTPRVALAALVLALGLIILGFRLGMDDDTD